MIAILRYLSTIFSKERVIFSNYNRAHPHFLRYLVLDALFSVVLVFSAFQYSSANPDVNPPSLQNSGAVALTSTQLTKVVEDSRFVAYWLGPISGYKYTLITTRKGEVIVSYFPSGSDMAKVNEVRLTVTTYADPSKVQSPLCSRGDATTGNSGEVCTNPTTFNRDTMKEETTVIRGTDIRVVINYASAQTVATMVKNGSSLKRIG